MSTLAPMAPEDIVGQIDRTDLDAEAKPDFIQIGAMKCTTSTLSARLVACELCLQ